MNIAQENDRPMDVVLNLLDQRPREDWRWTLDPNVKTWSRANALALANCALLSYSDDTTIKWHLHDRGFTSVKPCNGANTQSFVAARDDAIVIAFRGTEPTKALDFATDLNARQIQFQSRFQFGGWGRIHAGFADGLQAVQSQIMAELSQLPPGNRCIWIAGHSLGGALATVMAALLANHPQHRIGGVYTIGSPRVGDPAFVARYKQELDAITFRHVNDRDIVPHVPPRKFTMLESWLAHPDLQYLVDLFSNKILTYEHVGQLHLLLPNDRISQNSADEMEREPEFLRGYPDLLQLPTLLRALPQGILDHAPIGIFNQNNQNGYIDRLERLL